MIVSLHWLIVAGIILHVDPEKTVYVKVIIKVEFVFIFIFSLFIVLVIKGCCWVKKEKNCAGFYYLAKPPCFYAAKNPHIFL